MENQIDILISYLENNFHLPLSMDEIAQSVGISKSRLQHLFKENKGVSITQYLQQLRLNKAAELLISTTLSVKKIRLSVGINDAAHFSAYFKRAFGMTPTAYREKFFDLEAAINNLKNKKSTIG